MKLLVYDLEGFIAYFGRDFTDEKSTTHAERKAMQPFADFVRENTASDRIMNEQHNIVLY